MGPKKGKKDAKGKKDKKSPKSASSKGSSKETTPASNTSTPPPNTGDSKASAEGSLDFEAGIIFNKYDKSGAGVLTASEFRQIWREAKDQMNQLSAASGASGITPLSLNNGPTPAMPAERKISFSSQGSAQQPEGDIAFEAGKVFSIYDTDKDGRLDKNEFEKLVRNHPELLKGPPPPKKTEGTLPVEVITGRLLTHFDETAGLAIPKQSVEEHKAMGNSVKPLVTAYSARYDHLRHMVTSKLLPRREHLLQLRRQLNHTSSEVTAAKTAIERETKTDMEQILERLRAVESMRQSAITHQVLALDEELQAIERTVRRVEQANDSRTRDATQVGGGISLVTTSAALGTAALESVRAPQAALMVEVIQQFNELQSEIDRLSSKQIEVQVEFPTDDFPKETAERIEIISRCDRYSHALSVKDHMLWTTIKEKERLEEQLNEERELSGEYAAEVARWAEMSQSLAQQVTQLKDEHSQKDMKVNALIEILRQHNIHVSP